MKYAVQFVAKNAFALDELIASLADNGIDLKSMTINIISDEPVNEKKIETNFTRHVESETIPEIVLEHLITSTEIHPVSVDYIGQFLETKGFNKASASGCVSRLKSLGFVEKPHRCNRNSLAINLTTFAKETSFEVMRDKIRSIGSGNIKRAV